MRDSEAWSVRPARRLRREMTNAEVILWSRLRQNCVSGMRFRRQHPIGPYIADFACLLPKLVIEVDGDTHSRDAELRHDRTRDAFMRARGWRIFRITNQDVYKNLGSVLDQIVRFAPPPPALRAPPP